MIIVTKSTFASITAFFRERGFKISSVKRGSQFKAEAMVDGQPLKYFYGVQSETKGTFYVQLMNELLEDGVAWKRIVDSPTQLYAVVLKECEHL